MGQARDTLGSEQEMGLPLSLNTQISNYSRQLDRWLNKFSTLFTPNPHIGDFPRKGLQMHYHFGKLHLGHHVFKGLRGAPVPVQFQSAAVMAHDAAISIFEMIIDDHQLQDALLGMPHYFHIMIAFAGHFLLEVCNKYHEQLSISLESDLGLISRVLACLRAFPVSHNIPSVA